MKRVFLLFTMLVIGIAASDAHAQITKEEFDQWADMRFGPKDGTPRYWYGIGPVRDSVTGKTLYTFEYYDTTRQIVDPKRPDRRIGISRKLDLFRDGKSGALLDTLDGKKVAQLPYPYQMFEMDYDKGVVTLRVTQGQGAHLRTHTFQDSTYVQRFGQFVHFLTPAHFEVNRPEMPGMTDFYTMTSHFILCQTGCAVTPRFQWEQAGVSAAPPWAGGDGRKTVFMFVSGAAFDSFAQLPAETRRAIEAHYPEWREPPRDLKQIEQLQKGN